MAPSDGRAAQIDAMARRLEELVPGHWARDASQTSPYARDMWARLLVDVARGRPAGRRPDLVAWPGDVGEVQAIVAAAVELAVPVVPVGAGSGVCGGAVPVRGGLVVDLRRMARIVELDEEIGQARVEAGMEGLALELELEDRGWTLGHFPSSIMCSTLGGWIATRGAGQMSTRYGKIEDLIAETTWVDGRSRILRLPAGRAADVSQLLVGSEGCLGILVEARLCVRRTPPARVMRGWELPSMSAGMDAVRALLQSGLRPAVVRLYDELDTLLHRRAAEAHEDPDAARRMAALPARTWAGRLSPRPPGARRGQRARERLLGRALERAEVLGRVLQGGLRVFGAGCLLVVGFEGERDLVEAEHTVSLGLLERSGARDLGPGPGQRWLAERYGVSMALPGVYEAGLIVDTMEIAAPWRHLDEAYQAVRRAVGPLCLVLAHLSHAYEDGACVYFTFVGKGGERDEAIGRLDEIWRRASAAVVESGAAVSHHHGVGMLKAGALRTELGSATRVIDALGATLDPKHVMNPGKWTERP